MTTLTMKAGAEKAEKSFWPNMMAYTHPEDLMKNLQKAMASISGP